MLDPICDVVYMLFAMSHGVGLIDVSAPSFLASVAFAFYEIHS